VSVLPIAKSLILCDYHIGYQNGKTDLYGIFNAIRPKAGYPHRRASFCVFALLNNGHGATPFFVDVRFAPNDQLVFTTNVNSLVFPNRTVTVQLALTIEGAVFAQPGLYIVELFCNNTWLADTTLVLR
jgi:hypothetical protein